MASPAEKQRKEEVSILITSILRRGYQCLIAFSGKDEGGNHVRVVAGRNIAQNVPSLGEVWRIEGEYRRDSIYGLQFYASHCKRLSPQGRLVVLFLANNPRFKGIGLSKARMLYNLNSDC